MKKGDYKIRKQNTKEVFERMIDINGNQVNFMTEITKNHNNGTFKIKPTISFHHCSLEPAEHKAFLKLIGDLAGEAMEACMKWKKEYEADNPKQQEIPDATEEE